MLATCTTQACSQGMVRGYRTRSYLEGIPLLEYVDDTMFFKESLVERSNESIHTLGFICKLFWSAHQLSQISFVCFILDQEEELQCSETLGLSIGTL